MAAAGLTRTPARAALCAERFGAVSQVPPGGNGTFLASSV